MSKKYWFKAKQYGWGWSPSSWQGWAVICLYISINLYLFYSIYSSSHSVSDTLINYVPTCKGVLEDAKLIIHKFNVSVGDLKDDPRYKNIDQINSRVEDSLLDSDEEFEKGHNTNFKFNDTPRWSLS